MSHAQTHDGYHCDPPVFRDARSGQLIGTMAQASFAISSFPKLDSTCMLGERREAQEGQP